MGKSPTPNRTYELRRRSRRFLKVCEPAKRVLEPIDPVPKLDAGIAKSRESLVRSSIDNASAKFLGLIRPIPSRVDPFS